MTISAVPLERNDAGQHRRELALAVRRHDSEMPRAGNLTLTSNTTITGTSYVSLTGPPWTIGYRQPHQLRIVISLDWQVNGSVIWPLDVQVLLDSTQIREITLAPMAAFLISPVPVPLVEGSTQFTCALQDIAPGPRVIDLQAKTATGGSWGLLTTSVIEYTSLPAGAQL